MKWIGLKKYNEKKITREELTKALALTLEEAHKPVNFLANELVKTKQEFNERLQQIQNGLRAAVGNGTTALPEKGGYTEEQINHMTSEEYREKVLRKLKIRGA